MSPLLCPVCRREVVPGADVSPEPLLCPVCRVPLTPSSSASIQETAGSPGTMSSEPAALEIAPCPRCGKPVSSLLSFCPHCGEPPRNVRVESPWRGGYLPFTVLGGMALVSLLVAAWRAEGGVAAGFIGIVILVTFLIFLGFLIEMNKAVRPRGNRVLPNAVGWMLSMCGMMGLIVFTIGAFLLAACAVGTRL